MGQYIACGIATRIVVENRYNDEKNEDILERLAKKIDFNIYDIVDCDGGIIFTIKENIFEKYAISFIKEQLQQASEYDRKKCESLEELEGKKYDELMEIANAKSITSFQFLDGCSLSGDVSYLDRDGRNTIYCDAIYYILEGKVFFECYYNLFEYLRNCIINTSNNLIKTSAMVTIIG